MRPRKPTQTKKLSGTLRKSRVNVSEPSPDMIDTGPMIELDDVAKKYRAYVVPLLEKVGIMSELDPSEIDILCATYSEWVRLDKYIREELKNASSYEHYTQAGMSYKAYPEYKLRADAANRLHKILTEFGMTPASRSKVNANKTDKKDDNPFKSLKLV